VDLSGEEPDNPDTWTSWGGYAPTAATSRHSLPRDGPMTVDPSTTTEPDIDEDEPSWTDFVLPVGLFALAVLPFTPLWEQIADPDTTRRRYGAISRFLADVGPVPVALTFAGLGLVFLVVAIRGRARSRPAAAESSED
jgi:hypothetical protein